MTALVARAGAGDLAFAAAGAAERMALGSLLHRRHQERRWPPTPSYRSEVPLALSLEHAGREVRIEGRADGLRSEPDGAFVLEELKSAAARPASGSQRLALERLQVELYAFLLARTGRPVARAELLWLVTDDEAGVAVAAREEVHLELASIEARASAGSSPASSPTRAGAKACAPRAAPSQARCASPSRHPARGRARSARRCERALGSGRHLLLEAPTGIGKTAAVLLPALAHAFREGGRMLYFGALGDQVQSRDRQDQAQAGQGGGGTDQGGLQLEAIGFVVQEVLFDIEPQAVLV